MHGYLERWEAHVKELQIALDRETADHASDIGRANTEIEQLKSKLATQTQPLERQIVDQARQIRDLQAHIKILEQERATAIDRLAHLVEIAPTTKGITVLTLINDIILLVDETKKQFRGSL